MRYKRQALAGARAAAIRNCVVASAVEDVNGDVFPIRRTVVLLHGKRHALVLGDIDIVRSRDGRERRDPRRRARVACEVIGHQPALRLARGVDALRVDAEAGFHVLQDLEDVGDVVDVVGDLGRTLPVAALFLAVLPRGRVHDDVVASKRWCGQEV